jgi:hypothetical protein
MALAQRGIMDINPGMPPPGGHQVIKDKNPDSFYHDDIPEFSL